MMLMNKGISAIIATILLVLIAVALVGTAYLYVSGMLTGRTSKSISISDVSCTSNNITIVVSNDGTSSITNTASSKELRIFVDNVDRTSVFNETGGTNSYTIAPHSTIVLLDNTTGYSSGTHTVLVVSPSNSVREVVFC